MTVIRTRLNPQKTAGRYQFHFPIGTLKQGCNKNVMFPSSTVAMFAATLLAASANAAVRQSALISKIVIIEKISNQKQKRWTRRPCDDISGVPTILLVPVFKSCSLMSKLSMVKSWNLGFCLTRSTEQPQCSSNNQSLGVLSIREEAW
jgi:hypothetical protein